MGYFKDALSIPTMIYGVAFHLKTEQVNKKSIVAIAQHANNMFC